MSSRLRKSISHIALAPLAQSCIVTALRNRPRAALYGWVAQLVEQRTENPRVGGSIPSPATTFHEPVNSGRESPRSDSVQVKKKKQNRRPDPGPRPVSKQQPERTSAPVLLEVRPWHIFALALVVAVVAIGFLVWKCTRDPNINFLPLHNQAEWVLFPRAMDSTGHQVASVDTIFRKQFTLSDQPRAARLDLRAAKRAELKINGTAVPIPAVANWKDLTSLDVGTYLKTGDNNIEVKVINDTAPSALWLTLNGNQEILRTDPTWEASSAGSAWRRVMVATNPRLPGAGNGMADGEETIASLRKVWLKWLLFSAIAAAICFIVHRWFPWVLESAPGRGFSRRQSTVLIAIVVTLWVALYWNNAVLMPFRHGFDAGEHAEYIKYIQEHGSLPLPTEGFEMFQPPLYYLISAGVLSVFGLTVDDHSATLVLRFLTFVFAFIQFTLVFLSMRLLFRDRFLPQLIGLLLAAFLPMQIYLSHFVTNETLAATMVTASVYLALRLLATKNPSTSQYAWLGLCLGAAMLSKATALLAVFTIFLVLTARLLLQRVPVAVWIRRIGVMSAVFLIVCGWQYLRIWLRYGNPFLGNWDAASGFLWWQDPGYHTVLDYVRFGTSLVAPFFSGLWSFADGIYSTLWGDALIAGVPTMAFRPLWNYDLIAAGYLLSVVLTVVILAGAGVAFWRFARKPSAEWFILFGLAGAVVLGVAFMTLRVASYAQVKAFYGLAIAVPLCAFGAVGWEVLTRGRRIVQGALGILLLVWAMNSYASHWAVSGSTQHVYAGLRLGAEGNVEAARVEANRAVETDPSNATARRFLSFMLGDSGRAAEGLPQAQRAVELNPGDGASHLQLAIVMGQQNQVEAAIQEARRALELAPENVSAYTVLQGFYSRSGQE